MYVAHQKGYIKKDSNNWKMYSLIILTLSLNKLEMVLYS